MVELTDFMPIDDDGKYPDEIIRMVSVIRGNVKITMRCQPRFNYGLSAHRAEISDRCARLSRGRNLLADVAVFHGCLAARWGRRGLAIQPASRRNGNFHTWWKPLQGSTNGTGIRTAAVSGDKSLLESLDRTIELQGPMARNGKPFGADVEVADQPKTRVFDCCANVLVAGGNWRSTQLGLSLYVAARCHLHAVCAHSPGLCRGNGGVHWLARKGRLSDDANWRADCR